MHGKLFVATTRAIDINNFALLALLAFISTPYLIVKYARQFWNSIKTRKYKREGAILGFVKWWRWFSENRVMPQSDLNVVYGHTHLTNIIDSPNDIKCILGKETTFKGCLLNLPAWSKDLSEEKVEELQTFFLYIDEGGNWFFGWNYENHQPFLIPKQLIKERRRREHVVKDDKTASALEAIGWPKLLIDEWKKPSRI